MRRSLGLASVFSLLCLATALPALAATTGTSNVTLAAAANSMVDILDATLTLTPSSTDYDNDYVQATGASGLRVRVKTNSSNGVTLQVKCADASPQIALSDILLKTATAAGTGGTTMSSFTAVTATNQTLWSTTVAQHPWQTVTTDVRVQNLGNYDDAPGGSTTPYTNTLTYTVFTP